MTDTLYDKYKKPNMLGTLKTIYNPKQSWKQQMEWWRKSERNVYSMLYDESLSNILCFYNKGMGSRQVGIMPKAGKD